jgi:6-phosphogluconate dehydrogenase
MRMGMIGLGRMGYNMATRLLRGGHEVMVYNRSPEKAEQLAKDEGAVAAKSLEELVGQLSPPRTVWLMLPAGAPTEEKINELAGMLDSGDILVDGANSNHRHDPPRYEKLKKAGIHYLDAGISGGIWGLTVGYCTMVGGDREAFEAVEPLFKTLAPEDGYLYCGKTGAGHFVKMVHNGIEYGMLQAYAEGFDLLQASDYAEDFDYRAISHLWNQGSVIRSWLLELAESAFDKDARLDELEAHVDDSGEGRWSVHDAVDSAVYAPVITMALMTRFRSRDENSFADRLIAALRNEFGGHTVKKSKD